MKGSGFFKGMATGLVVGATVTMIADPISDKQHKKISKKSHDTFKNIGSMIDNAMSMMS